MTFSVRQRKASIVFRLKSQKVSRERESFTLLGLPLKNLYIYIYAVDCMAYTTEVYFHTVLEAGKSTIEVWRALFLACRQPPSCSLVSPLIGTPIPSD